jgi:hypothetical protein
MTAFIKAVLRTRQYGVLFSKLNRKAESYLIPPDIILSSLDKKLEIDTIKIGAHKYEIDEEISKMTNTIIENDELINNSVNYLHKRQNELCEYLIKFNKYREKKSLDTAKENN